MKPILFNTEMTRLILDGKKTVTRRVIKNIPEDVYRIETDGLIWYAHWGGGGDGYLFEYCKGIKPPCYPDDILYVREAWAHLSDWIDTDPELGILDRYIYKADWFGVEHPRWRPSIHMPKEAARIFLRVTEVSVERLRDISRADVFREGSGCGMRLGPEDSATCGNGGLCDCEDYQTEFSELWDSTIKPKDRDIYGWDANPWVWVIAFERCEKPEVEA
ncbi:MAG: hypothetical protein LUH03_09850 [Oscillospiraceae bacterium]|nr:hypothetical protein [Oscillospiraceae bacterium]